MDDLVGRGGGSVFPVSVNPDVPFGRLRREISAYYLLSFEPEGADRDGRNHDINVRVSRRGLTVRARPLFSAEPAGSVKAGASLLTSTLRSALSAADFGLSLSTYAYHDEASGRVKIILGADIDRSSSPTGPLSLAYYVRSQSGNLVFGDEEKALLPPAGSAVRTQHFMGGFVLDPGTYIVKFAVVDENGRRASVEREFDAKVTAVGQLWLGDVMLARVGTSGTLRPIIDGRV